MHVRVHAYVFVCFGVCVRLSLLVSLRVCVCMVHVCV